MTLERMFQMARANLKWLIFKWEGEYGQTYDIETRESRLTALRQELSDLKSFRRNGFKND